MEIENGKGGDWQGCRVFPLASNGKDDYLISAELRLLPLKSVILLSFSLYNRLKCIYPLIMRRRLILSRCAIVNVIQVHFDRSLIRSSVFLS